MARSSQNFYDGGNERRNEFNSNSVYSFDTPRRQINSRFADEKPSAGGTYQARRVDSYGRQSDDVQNRNRISDDVQNRNRISDDVQNRNRISDDVQNRNRISDDVQNRNRISVDSNRTQNYNQQTNSYERGQGSSKVYGTTNQSSNKPRSLVLDINISLNAGRGNSQATVRTNDITTRSQPINSRATIDNVRFLDIDIRSPGRTAELKTDGIIRDR
ncbi:unnamed protein product [Rotaria sordida]|uniref:Uncharacterized protein n=1 Tax=Rotaria sordida TaxID=392033 RepID=A0A814E629_9BILA|nr:unnamed protein product [Rotaria sordida]CAF1030576.1 unnamed protein product [Rotaria sordida]